jgi:hypothetical protein
MGRTNHRPCCNQETAGFRRHSWTEKSSKNESVRNPYLIRGTPNPGSNPRAARRSGARGGSQIGMEITAGLGEEEKAEGKEERR